MRQALAGMLWSKQFFFYDVDKWLAEHRANPLLAETGKMRNRESEKFQNYPHWRDHLLFYEYFHGDNGAGIGAGHQTGWTGLAAPLIEIFGHLDAKGYLEAGRAAAFERA